MQAVACIAAVAARLGDRPVQVEAAPATARVAAVPREMPRMDTYWQISATVHESLESISDEVGNLPAFGAFIPVHRGLYVAKQIDFGLQNVKPVDEAVSADAGEMEHCSLLQTAHWTVLVVFVHVVCLQAVDVVKSVVLCGIYWSLFSF